MGTMMITADDPVTVILPRSTVGGILSLSSELTDRMHGLMELNTDGRLTSFEKLELETVFQMTHFGRSLAAAFGANGAAAGQR